MAREFSSVGSKYNPFTLCLPECPRYMKRESTDVRIYPELGIVLKEFWDEETYEREMKAYRVLRDNNLGGVPKFYGEFLSDNPCIVVEFVGETLEQEGENVLNDQDWYAEEC
ncbi:hypothetical protein PQX77_022293 [Marasmius sp. AFHP31]|nr:hypothetical protein PQX77_022293 [Marasmius sp. AFHP31]